MAYPHKRGSGSRDIGLSSNGKGSASRITDDKAYAENFDAIDWGHSHSNLDVDPGGPPIPAARVTEGRPGELRYPDGDTSGNPEIPQGWRKLRPGEDTLPEDYYESVLLGRWRGCGDSGSDFPASRYNVLNVLTRIRKI
jgi:hypothetical protein